MLSRNGTENRDGKVPERICHKCGSRMIVRRASTISAALPFLARCVNPACRAWNDTDNEPQPKLRPELRKAFGTAQRGTPLCDAFIS